MRGVPLIYKRKLEQVRFSGGILPQLERISGKSVHYSSLPMLRVLHYHPLFCLTLIYTFHISKNKMGKERREANKK